MTQERWNEVNNMFENVRDQITKVFEELEKELGEHRDEEYLAQRQLERADEHMGDAQEHWRKVEVDRDR